MRVEDSEAEAECCESCVCGSGASDACHFACALGSAALTVLQKCDFVISEGSERKIRCNRAILHRVNPSNRQSTLGLREFSQVAKILLRNIGCAAFYRRCKIELLQRIFSSAKVKNTKSNFCSRVHVSGVCAWLRYGPCRGGSGPCAPIGKSRDGVIWVCEPCCTCRS